MKDQKLRIIINALNGNRDDKEYIKYTNQYFLIKDNILCRSVARRTRSSTQLTNNQVVVPITLIPIVLKWLHNHPLHGHPGFEITSQRAKSLFYWSTMLKDIRTYIKNCDICFRHKGHTKNPVSLGTYPVPSKPFERVHLDLLTGFYETDRGNKNLLVIIDALTRYTELIPLKSKTAIECARKFYECYICRHGIPNIIISDSGGEFNNHFLNSLCEILQIKKINTMIYHPESNGLVERVNRKVLDILRVNIGGMDPNWDIAIPTVSSTLNNNYHTSIRMSPHEAVYGIPARSPFHILTPTNNLSDPLKDIIDVSRSRFQTLYQNLLQAQVLMKNAHDKKAKDTKPYQEGDIVYVQVYVRKGLNWKLLPKFEGPFIVIEVLVGNRLRIRNQSDPTDVRTVSVSHVRA